VAGGSRGDRRTAPTEASLPVRMASGGPSLATPTTSEARADEALVHQIDLIVVELLKLPHDGIDCFTRGWLPHFCRGAMLKVSKLNKQRRRRDTLVK
jgi:hypothetical protein